MSRMTRLRRRAVRVGVHVLGGAWILKGQENFKNRESHEYLRRQ
jgi:hypothetical protein